MHQINLMKFNSSDSPVILPVYSRIWGCCTGTKHESVAIGTNISPDMNYA